MSRPREPWRVIVTQNGTQLAEVPHTSEAKAYAHVRMALRSGAADTAKVMQWSEGRWWHFETVHANEIPDA
jgi:hypothetical protein